MIRFILLRKIRDGVNGLEFQTHATLDAEVPELESALKRGGLGESSYDLTTCIDAIIVGEGE